MSSMLDEAIRSYPAGEQPPGSWWVPQRYGGTAPSLAEAARMDEQEKAERAARREARAGSAALPSPGDSP
jgi:hypothetical protein